VVQTVAAVVTFILNVQVHMGSVTIAVDCTGLFFHVEYLVPAGCAAGIV
jgi:hypothetical protein